MSVSCRPFGKRPYHRTCRCCHTCSWCSRLGTVVGIQSGIHRGAGSVSHIRMCLLARVAKAIARAIAAHPVHTVSGTTLRRRCAHGAIVFRRGTGLGTGVAVALASTICIGSTGPLATTGRGARESAAAFRSRRSADALAVTGCGVCEEPGVAGCCRADVIRARHSAGPGTVTGSIGTALVGRVDGASVVGIGPDFDWAANPVALRGEGARVCRCNCPSSSAPYGQEEISRERGTPPIRRDSRAARHGQR